MCLCNPSEIRVAERDIPCYKVVLKNLKSIYYNFQYEIGKEFDLGKSLEYKHNYKFPRSNVINEGFHSYIKAPIFDYIYTTIKCVIPKGAEYSVGYNGLILNCYVSNKIKVEKIVNSTDNE